MKYKLNEELKAMLIEQAQKDFEQLNEEYGALHSEYAAMCRVSQDTGLDTYHCRKYLGQLIDVKAMFVSRALEKLNNLKA